VSGQSTWPSDVLTEKSIATNPPSVSKMTAQISVHLTRNAGWSRMSPTESSFCFGCHATAASTGNHFDPKHLIPGISCEACHGPGAAHIAEISLGNEQSPALIMNPARLGPVDSVDFCGACHRTSVDVALTGVTGILSLRFPAFRLQSSRCWGSGDARLTCIACHNPHQSLAPTAETYDNNRLSCHAGKSVSEPITRGPGSGSAPMVPQAKPESARGPACPVGQKACVTCHMPKYTIPEMHATFTDHKIAIHRRLKSFAD
jgi:Cytochrome c554 and c-prime